MLPAVRQDAGAERPSWKAPRSLKRGECPPGFRGVSLPTPARFRAHLKCPAFFRAFWFAGGRERIWGRFTLCTPLPYSPDSAQVLGLGTILEGSSETGRLCSLVLSVVFGDRQCVHTNQGFLFLINRTRSLELLPSKYRGSCRGPRDRQLPLQTQGASQRPCPFLALLALETVPPAGLGKVLALPKNTASCLGTGNCSAPVSEQHWTQVL